MVEDGGARGRSDQIEHAAHLAARTHQDQRRSFPAASLGSGEDSKEGGAVDQRQRSQVEDHSIRIVLSLAHRRFEYRSRRQVELAGEDQADRAAALE